MSAKTRAYYFTDEEIKQLVELVSNAKLDGKLLAHILDQIQQHEQFGSP